MMEKQADGTFVYVPIVMVGICRSCGADVPAAQFFEVERCDRCLTPPRFRFDFRLESTK